MTSTTVTLRELMFGRLCQKGLWPQEAEGALFQASVSIDTTTSVVECTAEDVEAVWDAVRVCAEKYLEQFAPFNFVALRALRK